MKLDKEILRIKNIAYNYLRMGNVSHYKTTLNALHYYQKCKKLRAIPAFKVRTRRYRRRICGSVTIDFEAHSLHTRKTDIIYIIY